MTKILFIELELENLWALAAVGPAYIVAYLRQHGHEASLLRLPLSMTAAQVVNAIHERRPQVIGMSLTSRQWSRAKELLPHIDQHVAVPVIAGGLQPTFASDLVLNTPGFDYVCIGEGEVAMLEFVEAIEHGLPIQGLKNIRARGEPLPQLHPPFEPIDQLPFPARDMLAEHNGVVHVSTQRGCPYPCTYCGAPTLARLYDGGYSSYGRRRSAANVLAELDGIRRHGQLNYVVYLDDTFTINHAWLKEFCTKYAQQVRVPFSINARAETVNQRSLTLLADAGCAHIVYGVESGSERIRWNVLRRGISNDQLKKVFQWTRDAGILVTANYMLGIPEERPEDIEQTLRLHDELQPDDFGYFVFYPYPGTSLFYRCKHEGYLPHNYHELPANHRTSILSLPDLSNQDIEKYYQKFTELRILNHMKRVPPDGDVEFYRQQIIEQVRSAATRG